MNTRPLAERIDEKVFIDPNSGCWLWMGATSRDGYGHVWVDGHMVKAHRAMYRFLRTKIPPGMTLDHLCRVRACVNPDHLEVVTIRENILRGDAPAARKARQTHCVHGHPFSPDNTYHLGRNRRSYRACRTCTAARDKKRYARAKGRVSPEEGEKK